MPHLRCTRKLLTAIGNRSVHPIEQIRPAILGDWYAHLLVISRQHALLFTNEATLYSFAVLGVRKAEFSKLPRLFVEQLQRNLAYESIPPYVIDRLMAEYRDVTLAETASRSVLGSMNDLANLLNHYVRDAGGPSRCDLLAINKQLSQTPHKPLGWKVAAEVLRERVLATVAVPGRQHERLFLN